MSLLEAVRRLQSVALLTAVAMSAQLVEAQAPADGALLQVDVVVVDRHGAPVTDLKAADFDVAEKGAHPAIVDCQFVSAAEAPRTTTFVVDDLALSIRSVSAVREALSQFVDGQMRPGDQATVARTYGGYSRADTFPPPSGDRKTLHDAIDGLRYNGLAAGGGAHVAAANVREEILAYGSLRGLAKVVADLSPLPGRKSLILFSEGIDPLSGRFVDVAMRDALDAIVEAANRASIVIYTLDARGVPSSFGSAWWPAQRQAEHAGLLFLAEETGGIFIRNTDVPAAVARMIDAERGHYVLRYRSAAPERGQGHPIDVQVKRAGLKGRARNAVFAEGPAAAKSSDRSDS
jgi:VWFA-related protein